jgi:predicted nucleic acid-binding protein
LIDTGVWIDYLQGLSSVAKLTKLLDENLVCIHTLIEAELRCGSIKNRDLFFNSFTKLPYIAPISESIIFRFIKSEKLFGLGLSIIDIHLYASAKAENIKIWTKDKQLTAICKKSDLLFN